MSTLPESLRRVLAAQKKPAAFVPPAPRGDLTTIWRDGEIWRETTDGKRRQLASIPPIR